MTASLFPDVRIPPVYHAPWPGPTFAHRLYLARCRRGYRSQKEWARWSGFSLSSIEDWESGEKAPRGDSLRLICLNLRVSADWLLGLTDEGPKRPIHRFIVLRGRR